MRVFVGKRASNGDFYEILILQTSEITHRSGFVLEKLSFKKKILKMFMIKMVDV